MDIFALLAASVNKSKKSGRNKPMASFYGDNFTEDGRLFNREGKRQIMEVLFCGGDLLKLAGLVVKEAWLRDDGEGYPPNTRFLMTMLDNFTWENSVWLINLSQLHQKTIMRVGKWLIVLYRNDQMYFERIGGCILFVIMRFPEYKDDLPGLLQALKDWYLQNEKRVDRYEHMQRLFALVQAHYAKGGWFQQIIDWCFRYLYEHREKFNWQIPSSEDPDRSVYDPLVWAGGPKGRGGEWIMVNGGHG
jgi:hypothetical protein